MPASDEIYKDEFADNMAQNNTEEEIINLKAIMNLPKGTEHFVSDIHGEYEMFCIFLKLHLV